MWPGGKVDLTFFIGSRRMGRSFAFEYKQHLYQAPVGYYANRHAWDLAPGYERDSAPDLTRPITPDCLYCHATRATLESGTLNRYREIVHGDSVCPLPRRIGGARQPRKPAETAGSTP